MDKEAAVQTKDEPRRLEKDWAEAEWFQVWLRLARHEYQGTALPKPELKQAA
jgi:hypothetical protein